jgi:Amidohydrolase family
MMSKNRPFASTATAITAALFLMFLCGVPNTLSGESSALPAAFVRVNVITMDSDRVLKDQTVVVEHGVITAVGASISIPQNAQIIDGGGKLFLSPGLADMHTHSQTREDLAIYLANGVTSVLNMGGASSEFLTDIRTAANEGRIPAPHVYIAFRVDGTPQYGEFIVTTPDEARWLVRFAKTNGYDFIKVYNNLSPECFYALVAEGKREHMAVVGHGVTRLGIKRQLAAGQVMVAHTEEFLYTVFSQKLNPDEIPAVIDFIKKDDAFVTADLNTYATIAKQWGKPVVVKSFLEASEMKYVDPDMRLMWKHEDYVGRQGTRDPQLQFLTEFTKAMADAGVQLIAGTDAPPIPGLVPGYSLHDDLSSLEKAGLSRYQILSTATRVPGEFISRYVSGAKPFGTVTVGSRADLILSDENPLDDLDTLRSPVGVMVEGNWYTRAA